MLRHYANGPFPWKTAMPCNTRTNWEFYAVLAGRCALRFSDQEAWVPYADTLWVFAPECSHGWTRGGDRAFHRVALHFSSVPEPLGELARQHGGYLSRPLGPEEAQRVHGIAESIAPHFHAPTRISHIHIQRHLMDLSLLLLEGLPAACSGPSLTDLAAIKIERALAWYAEHVTQRPTVEQVADAVHVSASHLRRLFGQIRDTSPKAAFQHIRLEKARELMGTTTLTLEEVASLCGYTDASHFCREHRALCAFTPTTWRKRLVDHFSDPRPPGMPTPRDCSVRPRELVLEA